MCLVFMDIMFTTYKYWVLYPMFSLDRRKKYPVDLCLIFWDLIKLKLQLSFSHLVWIVWSGWFLKHQLEKRKTKETGHVKSCSRTNIVCSNANSNDWSLFVVALTLWQMECETQKERDKKSWICFPNIASSGGTLSFPNYFFTFMDNNFWGPWICTGPNK